MRRSILKDKLKFDLKANLKLKLNLKLKDILKSQGHSQISRTFSNLKTDLEPKLKISSG
jgi:hypothetical protein